jgi:hypothetical protein
MKYHTDMMQVFLWMAKAQQEYRRHIDEAVRGYNA